ncbi:MAG: penicillin-binding transpeptidase domain-containing protein [Massilia sp.]
MAGRIAIAVQAVIARQRHWRRARNLRAGERAAARSTMHVEGGRGFSLLAGAVVLAAFSGAVVIAFHARQLSAATRDVATGATISVDALQTVIPGFVFAVPSGAGLTLRSEGGAAIVIAAGMRAASPVRVDLCSQMLDGSRPRLLPLRIGYRFSEIERLLAANQASGRALTLRNVLLASPTADAIPELQVSGLARADFSAPLQVTLGATALPWRWASDAGPGAMRREAWLVGKDAALRLQRRSSSVCPQAGELLVSLYRKNDDAAERALVVAFPAHGQAVSAWLRPGNYSVPATPRVSLEDQALFQELYARGLVQLRKDGLIELAPRDLPAWQAAPVEARVGNLAGWPGVVADPANTKLFKRLYRMADGEYVREQVRIFNNERRLLAWRVRPGLAGVSWQAASLAAPLAIREGLPLAAERLFAELPPGWGAWQRVAAWPERDSMGRAQPAGAFVAGSDSAGAADSTAGSTSDISSKGTRVGGLESMRVEGSIGMNLGRPARAGERLELMLVGRLRKVDGARLVGEAKQVCTGRACPSAGAVQLLTLEAAPGASRITLEVAPLEMADLAGQGEDRYRHLYVANGKLGWRPLAVNSGLVRAAEPAGVSLEDRNGLALWNAGAPTPAAVDAGLAPLLGLRADHANSIAGMLARLPAPDGQPHRARLSLDLALQKASQGALDCIGMRRGQWDGAHCSGGVAAPVGRQGGMVVIDTETGDVLAAAGAGAGVVDAANWNEVRDFDRADPARSPLRLPAFQHDGGAFRSPGSTFKIISALGMELAARRDPQLDSLLGGMPLSAINHLAAAKGFAFRTDAASYPVDTRLAHITNYKDQHLDRRAHDGKLGLSQALTYSLNTWFAWSGELSDRSLFGRADGGAPDLQALEPGALDGVRPIAAMARRLGFEQALRLDGGLLPPDFAWSRWDALQASEAHIDPIHTRHELRQMAIGLRMQTTPLQMALVAGAIGQGRVIAPRLLLELDSRAAQQGQTEALGVRLDRISEGMKGVVDLGTASAAFRGAAFSAIRHGLSGKTGTAPTVILGPNGERRELATVWFTGWLEPGSLPGQKHRLAMAAFVSHSEASGGEHAAPIVAAVLRTMAGASVATAAR